MPGPFVHLIVQQRLPAYLMEVGGKKGRRYGELLMADPCSPYAAVGSMGPDFLFFSLKEYGTPLDELVNFVFGVYDALEPFIDFYEATIAPVKQTLEDAITWTDDTLFQGTLGQIQATADLMVGTALEAAAAVLVKNMDLFYGFYPKIQSGAKEKDWYWCDYLHLRRTGKFCSTMWKLSKGDDDLMRYSLGYASHIGTDVAGHPYVNAIVGGPYRTHWHRHKLVENWIDAYVRDYYPDDAQVLNCLRLGSKDKYRANAISGSYYYRLCEFSGGRLPNDLGNMMLKALDLTYRGRAHPTTLSFGDLDTAYRLWLKWFERSTSAGSVSKPTPVPPPGAATVKLLKDYVSNFPSFPSGGGGGFSIWGFFAAMWEFIKWVGESLWYTFKWIIQHTWDIFTLPLTEALAFLKWLLYQIQKGVWTVYDELRFTLVMAGYLFPEPEDLQKGPYGQALLNPSYVHLMGGPALSFYQHPRRQEQHDLFGPMEHHLVYPATAREDPHAEAAPMPFLGAYPEVMVGQSHTYDPSIEKLYDCIGPYGNTDQYTHFVNTNSWHTPQFGSALAFTARLIGQRLDNLPNFNLDGDRGYGWKTWVARQPGQINKVQQVDVDYLDP